MTDTQPRPSWWPTVEQEAATAGVDSDVLWRISGAESSHGVNNVNPLSSARGPFQITGDTWNGLAVNSPSLNLTDPTDNQQQARAAPWLLKSNNQVLRSALKRDPSPTEQFIGWHAGIGRAPDLIRAPADTPVEQLFSPAAVQQNPEVFAKVKTAGDYRAWAAGKMEEPDYQAPAPQQRQPAFDLTTVLAPGRDRTSVDGMQPDLRVRLADLFAAAPPEVRSGLSITSGFRSPERQAEIMADKIGSVLGGDLKAKWQAEVQAKGAVAAGAAWATTLRDNGITKWVGLPGGSHHQKGDASDLGFGSDVARQWVHANAGRFGLSFPMAHEPWHIELSGARSGSGSSAGAPGTDGASLLPSRPGGAMTWATAVPSSPFTDTERSLMEQQGRQQQWSTAQAAWEAAKHENVVGWAMDAANVPRPDPNYSPTVDGLKQDQRLKGIDVSHYGYLMASRSQAEMDQRVDRLRDAITYDAKMGELGITGAALRMGASVLDPAGWLLSVASPLSGAAKLGRAGRILAGAVEGAAGNVAADIPRAMADPTYTRDQLLYTAAGGLAFGAAAGGFLKPHPAIRQEVQDIARSSGEMVRQIDTAASAGSVGAARDLSYVEPVRGDTVDFTDPAFVSKETGNVAFANARIDSAGRMKRDENPVIAATGGRMVEDAVGNADHSAVNRAVSVEAGMIRDRQSTFLVKGYRAAWEDYKDRNGIGWFQAREEESRFRNAVADWIDNPDPTAAVPDKAIVQAADAGREFFNRYHKLITDPGSLDGSVMAPLKGVKELEADPSYFPRIWDFMRFGEGEKALGSVGMRKLIRDSVLSAHPEMVTFDAERLAGGFYKGLQSVKAGQEVSVSRMVSGDDREGLRVFLRENTDMGEGDITRVLGQMEPASETGATARTKHRASMNVHFAADMMDHTTGQVRSVSLKEFLDRDFLRVSEMYNRQMSAQVALARLRIDNPRWRPGDGEKVPQFLVDGIRSDGDWDTLLKQARAVGSEMGHHPEVTEKGVARLQFTYDAIKGRLGATERGNLGTAIRIVKDYNFLRVMNQVGFAQAAETWNIMAQVGIKAAFSQMPTFRAIMRDARTGALNDDVMEQLEHMAAPGTDMLRGYAHLPIDDLGNVVRDSKLERLEGTLKRGTRLTSMLSGMAPITTYQQKWMAKAALARFAMDATGEKALNGKRMAVLGISPEMAGKIRDQLQRHEGYIQGESGTSLRVLHLDQWEPDARHALEYAIHTWTRKAIQENDLGQMNSILGSTVGKLMFQFRNFMFAAYTKQTLHASHMRDWESLSMMLGTSFFGGLTYAARTYLGSLGREDQKAYLERRLNAKALGAAAIQGGGWSSIFPMAADMGTYMLGMDPMFDSRVTGTPSQGITSNPTFDLLDNTMKASRGISGTLFRGEQFGQQDAQALRTVLPMGNFLPFLAVSNAMMHGLPRGDTHKHRD